MARFDPRLVQYDAARTQQFYKLLTERVLAAPGVRGAALTQNPPLGLSGFDNLAFVPDGFEMPRDREHYSSPMDTIDEGYFETLGIRWCMAAPSGRPIPATRRASRSSRAVRETLLARGRRGGPAYPSR